MAQLENELQHADAVCARGRQLLNTSRRIPPDVADGWFAEVVNSLEVLEREVNNPAHPTIVKQRLLSRISVMVTLKDRIEDASRSVIVGAGLRQQPDRAQFRVVETAFASRLQTGVISNMRHVDLVPFFDECEDVFVREIERVLRKQNAVRVYTLLKSDYMKVGEGDPDTKSFNTKSADIFPTTDLHQWFQDHVREPLLRDVEEFEDRDSGWTLHSILNLTVHINKYNPLRSSSYVALPRLILSRKCCINVKNNDEKCFQWAVLSALFPTERHAQRVQKYRSKLNEEFDEGQTVNFEGLQFPVQPRQIANFEKQNDTISVNVYMLELDDGKFRVVPCHLTKNEKEHHIRLLLIQPEGTYMDKAGLMEHDLDRDWGPIPYHYVWIKDLSKLLTRQNSKHNGKMVFCDRCLHGFHSEPKLESHKEDCKQVNFCRVKMPERWTDKSGQGHLLKFKNFKHKSKVPFVVYADFESFLKKTDEPRGKSTRVCEEHEAFSCAFYVKCAYNDALSRFESYRGEDPGTWLAQKLVELGTQLRSLFDNAVIMRDLTDEEKATFLSDKECHICEKPFKRSDIRVRDHDHFTGAYRGAAHQDCNAQYQDSRTIPVIFHNLTGYDMHFLVKQVTTCCEGQIDVLALNMEKYISLTKHLPEPDPNKERIKLRFIDSFRFMAASLDKLASYLPCTPITRSQFPDLDEDSLKLLTRKGVFPYEHVSSPERLEEKALPPKELFFSHLTGSDISDADYEHAQRVWTVFKTSTLGEYSDLYLKVDVLLLADVFENFRKSCLATYRLDPAHYYTAPGLTWDAMLYYTKQTLELLTDIDMYMFFERGIRGGVSQSIHRYAKANNPYAPDYHSDQPKVYLQYYDVNNLYGEAMQSCLPFGGFAWVDPDSMAPDAWRVADDSAVGYVLEVDLDYPRKLHNQHRDLPFCPENRIPPGSKQPKLLTTLYHKTRYIIHYRNLKQALDHGLELRRIHRVLKFDQSPWLKPYIDLNTDKRKEATNEFEKNLFKLMNNAVFGKTMEDVKRRRDIKLLTKWEGRYGAEAHIAQPNFNCRTIFAENLVGIQFNKTEVYLNKPMYVGFSVLDISKTSMYKFHYDIMPELVQDGSYRLLYTDTDSLIYSITTDDIYERIKANLHYFDTSDFPDPNPYNIPRVNKKVVGLMKDECAGSPMSEFVALRSKMYSVRVNGEDSMKKCKGVKANVVKRTLQFDDYKRCLDNDSVESRVQRTIVSREHRVYTIEQCKLALSPLDDKRYLVPPSKVETLPWGHYQSSDSEHLYEGEEEEEEMAVEEAEVAGNEVEVPMEEAEVAVNQVEVPVEEAEVAVDQVEVAVDEAVAAVDEAVVDEVAVRVSPAEEDSDYDEDRALMETFRICEENLAYNAREAEEEQEFMDVNVDVLNAIVDAAESMNVEPECPYCISTCTCTNFQYWQEYGYE